MQTKQATHTPGPWTVTKAHGAARDFGRLFHVTVEPGRVGCVADVLGPGELPMTSVPEIAEANARLIAAAPELLEALEQLVDAAAEVITYENSPITRARDAAIRAIAKATG